MAKQKIDTEKVASAANKLRSANSNINSEFRTLQGKSRQLDSDWKSKAGETARTTMYEIFKSNEERSTVLQNYINMLEQQINPGYIETEDANTTLADQFK